MASDERHESERARCSLSKDRTGRSAQGPARLAVTIAATSTSLAAQHGATAQLVPRRADELLHRARCAREFAEHERQEAQRLGRKAGEMLSEGGM